MRRALLALALLAACGDKPADDGTPTDDGGGDTEVVGHTDGDTDTTDTVVDDTDGGGHRHHPAGFDAPDVHGLAAKMQDETCVACHGEDLKGGTARVSCDTCHEEGWRTNCTYCHGEEADGTGSPPLHIDGQDDGANASYVPHRTHTSANAVKAAFDCTMCHAKPESVLSLGHLFLGDTTKGQAETDFSQSLSDRAVWNRTTGTCSQLYCHGNNGKDNGQVVHTARISGCKACHPDATAPIGWLTKMSGEHSKHLFEGLGCEECHASTVDSGRHVSDVTQHVDGEADTQFPSGMQYVGGQCTGSCHGETHDGRSWR